MTTSATPTSIPLYLSVNNSLHNRSNSSVKFLILPTNSRIFPSIQHRQITCSSVALKQEGSSSSATSSSSSIEEEEGAKIGARVRVKVPLTVYHVPKIPEIDITGMEGTMKQYVALWKGKRISANYPFKVQFVTEIEGRGPVKFFAHLKEDEFEYID